VTPTHEVQSTLELSNSAGIAANRRHLVEALCILGGRQADRPDLQFVTSQVGHVK